MEPLKIYSTDQIKDHVNSTTSLGTTPREIIRALSRLRTTKDIFKIKREKKKSYWMLRESFKECRNFLYTNHSKSGTQIQYELGKCLELRISIYNLEKCNKNDCDKFCLRGDKDKSKEPETQSVLN